MTLAQKFKITGLFDSHAHLTYSSPQEVNTSIELAQANALETIFNMGIDLSSSTSAIEQAKSSNNYLRAFIGIDPEVFQPGSDLFKGLENGDQYIEENFTQLINLADQNLPYICGIGETGMDYYHLEQNSADEDTKTASKLLQRILFIKHLKLAQELKLPLSIHSRWAEEECLEIIKNYEVLGIFHSYTGGYETAKKILDIGWGLGVNGIITFKNADQLRGIYKKLIGQISNDWSPLDFYEKGIFFETDAPFLAPEGKRGEKNEPAYVKLTFESFINFLKS